MKSKHTRFLTPKAELEQHLSDRRPPRTQPGFGLEPLLARMFQPNKWDLSLANWQGSFDDWQTTARPVVESLLLIPNSLGAPSEPETHSVTEEPDLVIEEVSFTVTPPLRAPATVVIPRNGKSRHPAVVVLHSLGGLRAYGREKFMEFEGEPSFLTDYRKENYSGRSLQRELARRGYLSIAIDAFNFGLRTAAAVADRKAFEQARAGWSPQEAADFCLTASGFEDPRAGRALGCVGLTTAQLVATDDRRTVDYLLSRSDVDPDRIGATGLSFGSFRTNYLSALDSRVKAGVSICWVSSMAGIIGYNEIGAMGWFSLPPGLYARMDMTDIIALAAPRAFLTINGWQDILMQPSGTAESHLALREAWERANATENLGSLVYDAPHEYNTTMQEDAFDFFDTHIA